MVICVGSVAEFVEAFVQKAIRVVRKLKPLTADPELRQATVQQPFTSVNFPKRFNTDNFYVRNPSSCFLESTGWISGFPDFKAHSMFKNVQITWINTVDTEYLKVGFSSSFFFCASCQP